MRRMNGGLVAALENEKLSTHNNGPEELPDHAESLETDVAEINEDAADGEAHQEATDEAEDTAAAMESMIVALEGFQTNGGLDDKGAHVLHLAVEHMLGRLGSSQASLVVPAMESFGGTGSRSQATTIALENLREELSKIWRAIVEAIKKAAEWVAGYWMKVFGAAERVISRAKKLEETARTTTGQAKNKEIDDKGIADKLFTNGGASPASGLGVLKSTTNAIVTRAATVGGEVGKKAIEAVKELTAKNLPEVLKLCEPIPGSKKIDNPQSVGVAAAPDGLAVYGTAELPGNFAVISWVPSGEKASVTEKVKQLGGVAYKTIKINKGSAGASGKLQVLSLAECGSIAKQVAGIAEELMAYRKSSSNLANVQKELGAAAEGVAAKAGEEADEAKREGLNAAKAIATAANRLLVEPGASFSKYAIQTLEAYLHYVEKSLKQYS